MSTRGVDTYIVMAVLIGLVSIATTIEQTVRFLDGLTFDGPTVTALLSGVFGQASLAFAMLSAIIVGRHVLTNRLLDGPAADQDNDTYREQPTDA